MMHRSHSRSHPRSRSRSRSRSSSPCHSRSCTLLCRRRRQRSSYCQGPTQGQACRRHAEEVLCATGFRARVHIWSVCVVGSGGRGRGGPLGLEMKD